MSLNALTDPKTLKVFGSFGFGNAGDEAVPGCFARLWAETFEPANVVPVSRYRKADLPDVVYTPDAGSPEMTKALSGHVFLTGGGIVEPRPVACARRAVELRRKYPYKLLPFACSADHSVAYGWRERRIVQQAFRDVPEVLARDDYSAETIAKCVQDKPVRTVGDIVLWITPDDRSAELNVTLPERFIAVTLADVWSDKDFYDWLIPELVEAGRAHDAELLLLPVSTMRGNDREIHETVVAGIIAAGGRASYLEPVVNNVPDPRWIAEIYRRAEVAISMRLHGCVMAFSQETPFVGIAYHPKVTGFAHSVGWVDYMLPGTLPAAQTDGTYGYSFADAGLKSGHLIETTAAAIQNDNFSAIPFYRARQQQALRKLVASL